MSPLGGFTQINDKSGRILEFDGAASGAYMVGIDIAHHKVHEGEHWNFSTRDADVDIAAPKYVRVTTAAGSDLHAEFGVSTTGAGFYELLEGPTIAAATLGTQATAWNRNRQSTKNCPATFYADCEVSATGIILETHQLPAGEDKKAGGAGGRSANEWILAAGTEYVYRFTVGADDAKVSMDIDVYDNS